MALNIDLMHGRGMSNKMHHQFQPKETKVRLYLAVTIAAKSFSYTHRNKTQCFNSVVISLLLNQSTFGKLWNSVNWEKRVAQN